MQVKKLDNNNIMFIKIIQNKFINSFIIIYSKLLYGVGLSKQFEISIFHFLNRLNNFKKISVAKQKSLQVEFYKYNANGDVQFVGFVNYNKYQKFVEFCNSNTLSLVLTS